MSRQGGRVPHVAPGSAPSTDSPAAAVPIEVHLDRWLREFGPHGDERLTARTLEELMDSLETKYPALRFKLRDEAGRLRKFVRVFVDGEDVSGSTGLATSLIGARTVDVLHSIAGG